MHLLYIGNRKGTTSPEFLQPLNIQFRDNLARGRRGWLTSEKWKAVEMKVKPQLQRRRRVQTCRQTNLSAAFLR